MEKRALLAEIAAEGSVDAVRLLLTQANDPSMQDPVADALVSMPGTAAIEWMFATGLSFPDPSVRAVSVLALGRSALRLKRALPEPVMERADDEDPSVRAAVAELLGESGDVVHLERLKALLADRIWLVRLAAAKALSCLDSADAGVALLTTACDADLTMRREGARLLAANPQSAIVARASLDAADPRIRALAAHALARLKQAPSSADRLRVEPDSGVVASLAAWHARAGDVASLVEALSVRPEADARLAIAWRCVPADEAQAKRLVEIASKEPDARVRDGVRSGLVRGGFAGLLTGDLALPAAPARDLPRLFARRGPALQGPEGAAVRAACEWLALHQEADGRWSCAKHNPWSGGIPFPDFIEEDRYVDAGVTGLAVLVFLGDGCRLDGEFGGVARRGVEYLLRHQAPNGKIDSAPSWAPSFTGSASPHDPNPHPSNASNYNHTIGALALAEAYAMSGDAALRGPAQRAIAHLFDAETAADLPWGGYLRGEDAAPSVFAIQALVVARAAGLDVDPAWLDTARDYVQALGDPSTGRPRFRHVMQYCLGGYDGAATLLSSRALLGMPLDDEAAKTAYSFIDPHRPNWNAHFEIPKGTPRSPSERWRNDDDILNFWYFRFATIA
ncbi:MAG: HEAT repeat domain-containing protein, partial [Planctomycetota bacterium]